MILAMVRRELPHTSIIASDAAKIFFPTSVEQRRGFLNQRVGKEVSDFQWRVYDHIKQVSSLTLYWRWLTGLDSCRSNHDLCRYCSSPLQLAPSGRRSAAHQPILSTRTMSPRRSGQWSSDWVLGAVSRIST